MNDGDGSDQMLELPTRIKLAILNEQKQIERFALVHKFAHENKVYGENLDILLGLLEPKVAFTSFFLN
jgi:hypothetical protein